MSEQITFSPEQTKGEEESLSNFKNLLKERARFLRCSELEDIVSIMQDLDYAMQGWAGDELREEARKIAIANNIQEYKEHDGGDSLKSVGREKEQLAEYEKRLSYDEKDERSRYLQTLAFDIDKLKEEDLYKVYFLIESELQRGGIKRFLKEPSYRRK